MGLMSRKNCIYNVYDYLNVSSMDYFDNILYMLRFICVAIYLVDGVLIKENVYILMLLQ